MNSRGQAICIWCGPATLISFAIAMVPAAHFIPPLSPNLTADEIVRIFQGNLTGIRIGAIFMLWAVAFYMGYTAAISAAIKQIEGAVSPLAYAQLLGGVIALFPFLIVSMLWSACAFRMDRSPDLILALNDVAWFTLVMPTPTGIVQPIATAIAILCDKKEKPTLPRWVGFFNVWVGILFLPGALVGLFKTGPFAWNGLFAFWVPAVVFGIYMLVMSYMLWQANKAEA